MTIAGIDFAALTFKDYAIGVVYAVLGTFIVTGFEMALNIALPGLAAAALGAAIGIAAWFTYLKRKS